MPSCSQPSRTLRAAEAVARRRAIPDRRCARRRIARAGRDGRMVPIEQKDCAEEDRASILGQNHPLDSTKKDLFKTRTLVLVGSNYAREAKTAVSIEHAVHYVEDRINEAPCRIGADHADQDVLRVNFHRS